MSARRQAQRLAAAAGCALVVSACGAIPPQAPLPEAAKLDASTSGISTACGEAYEVTALGGHQPHALSGLEATAAASARKLDGVLRRDPSWYYQGETVKQIASEAVSMLRQCGLGRAVSPLKR